MNLNIIEGILNGIEYVDVKERTCYAEWYYLFGFHRLC